MITGENSITFVDESVCRGSRFVYEIGKHHHCNTCYRVYLRAESSRPAQLTDNLNLATQVVVHVAVLTLLLGELVLRDV